MRKLNVIAWMMALIFALSTCAHCPYNSDGADAREAMGQSVKIEMHFSGTLTTLIGIDENGKPILEEEEIVSGWSGSGVVVAADRSRGAGESLVMSAAHVTHALEDKVGIDPWGRLYILTVEASMLTVQDLNGATCEGEEIYADVPNDVGVVRASCIAGDVAEIANELPPVGAMVMTSGAGLGIHPKGTFLVTDGRFVGFEDGFNPQMFLTLPVVGGHSGSGVWYRGKVFGIISRRTNRFEHGTLAVPLEKVKEAYARGLEAWIGG